MWVFRRVKEEGRDWRKWVGMMREREEVRKWMRQSYWDGGREGGRQGVQVMKGIDGYRGREEGGEKIKMEDGGVVRDECSYEREK